MSMSNRCINKLVVNPTELSSKYSAKNSNGGQESSQAHVAGRGRTVTAVWFAHAMKKNRR